MALLVLQSVPHEAAADLTLVIDRESSSQKNNYQIYGITDSKGIKRRTIVDFRSSLKVTWNGV
jgi:hypothetical protein